MTVKITRATEVTIRISAFDMGREFANMHSEDQAQFFNGVACAVGDWDKSACFQWQMMRDNMADFPEALACFRSMAEYAE